ncbi:acetyltransferase [Anopheles sinensis]|uniref:Acetyltransferase n=1 Tax=Anopheles sinensis TaxID=74873 RepID=A0A084WTG2_ANOSI|nr:acetyltransferase [Anopheles sinensis]
MALGAKERNVSNLETNESRIGAKPKTYVCDIKPHNFANARAGGAHGEHSLPTSRRPGTEREVDALTGGGISLSIEVKVSGGIGVRDGPPPPECLEDTLCTIAERAMLVWSHAVYRPVSFSTWTREEAAKRGYVLFMLSSSELHSLPGKGPLRCSVIGHWGFVLRPFASPDLPVEIVHFTEYLSPTLELMRLSTAVPSDTLVRSEELQWPPCCSKCHGSSVIGEHDVAAGGL